MDDAQIHARIEELVAEEHGLWDAQAAGSATEADRRRLTDVKVSLDRCWDALGLENTGWWRGGERRWSE